MLIDYLSNIKNVPGLCDKLESDVLKFFFKDGEKMRVTQIITLGHRYIEAPLLQYGHVCNFVSC